MHDGLKIPRDCHCVDCQDEEMVDIKTNTTTAGISKGGAAMKNLQNNLTSIVKKTFQTCESGTD